MERRNDNRVSKNCWALLQINTKLEEAVLEDIGCHGARLAKIDSPPDQGAMVRVTLPMGPGAYHYLKARTVWAASSQVGVKFEKPLPKAMLHHISL